MTLFRQISFFVVTLIFLLLLGTLTVSIFNTRTYFQDQLSSHAQDTATSLGLSVSPTIARQDWTTLNTMVDAIFDRGYYQTIVIEDAQGKLLLERHLPKEVEGVPRWFVDIVNLEVPRGSTDLLSGWQRAGRLWVESHPGYAYMDLWRTAQQGFLFFICVGMITLSILMWALRRALQPLQEVENQANAICNKDFSVQQPLPRARELRRVVQAMNRMTRQLKVVFDEQVAMMERVRQQAYIDEVTGLWNEFYFNSRYQARLDAPEESQFGAIMILRLKDFSHYNEKYGRTAGDLLLKQIAGRWQKILDEVQGSIVAKRSGADFIAWLPKVTLEEAEYYLHTVYGFITNLPLFSQKEKQQFIHIGLAHCDVGEDGSALLQNADEALRAAQAKGVNGTYVLRMQPMGKSSSYNYLGIDNKAWRQMLQEQLDQRTVQLHFQPVFSCLDQQVLYHEVLIRMQIEEELITAANFMPLVERFGLEESYDRMVIELIVQRLRSEARENTQYCVNVSPHSLQVQGFVEWVLDYLKENEGIAHRVIFEIPEYSLSFVSAKVQTLATGLRSLKAKVSIDRFGAVNRNFSYLSSLPLYAIKVDHSYVRDLPDNSDHQFFVQSLLRIAHSRDVLMMAESVENKEQWSLLKSFHVDAAQGYYLGRPQAEPVAHALEFAS